MKNTATFQLHKLRYMDRAGGKGYQSWLMVFEATDEQVYKTFHPIGRNPLAISSGCTITGTVKEVQEYLGEEQTVLTGCRIVPEEKPDTEEQEAQALGDNIELHHADNPDWYVVEGREDIIEDDVSFSMMQAQAIDLSPEQESWEAYADELEALRAGQWSEYIAETKNL